MLLKKIYKNINTKKIAFITGGNRGIGKCIAKELSKITYLTIIIASKNKNTKKFNFYLKKIGIKNILTFTLNLNNVLKIKKCIIYIKKKISIPSIIINNAGIKSDNIILKMSEKTWNKIININLTSAYIITKYFLPELIKLNWGRIINISSIIAEIGNIGQTNYSTSKAGIIGFSKSLSKEVAINGITVNIIVPGFIFTSMIKNINNSNIVNDIPIKKIGKTKDIINVIKLLISEKSSYITGETINVNGGLFMK